MNENRRFVWKNHYMYRAILFRENPPPRIIFKEFEDTKLKYGHYHDTDHNDKTQDRCTHQHLKFTIVICYYSFTGEETYYDDHVFKDGRNILNLTLREHRDNVLENWYNDKVLDMKLAIPLLFHT
jgi:hypothetical protein